MFKQSFFISVATAALLTAACGGDSTAVEAEVSDAVETVGSRVEQGLAYTVVPAASSVSWKGGKAVGDAHTGTFDITEGSLRVAGDVITGGEFTIDINSLTNTDLDENSGKGKLEGHLKSADFFDTENYPSAKFEVVSAEPVSGTDGVTHELVGNLTMRDETKSVSIPANVTIEGDAVMATTPTFTINRTDWGVKYGSGITGAVGDKVINDEVELTIKLEARKA